MVGAMGLDDHPRRVADGVERVDSDHPSGDRRLPGSARPAAVSPPCHYRILD